MRRFVVRRVAMLVPTLLVLSTLVFLLMHLAPGDPVLLITGPRVEAEVYQRTREQLGLDLPLHVQYGRFLANLSRGDLGRSIRTREEVSVMLARRLPPTLRLGLAAMVLSYVLALPAGLIAGLRPTSIGDYAGMTLALVGICVPSFWLGIVLMMVFAVKLGWLPVSGYATWQHMVLPVVTLGVAGAAHPALLLKASVQEVMRQDYIRTARAKGLAERVIVFKHALRNALLPIVTLLGLQVGWLAAGAVVVEAVFYWPGLGRLLVDSVIGRDYPVVQGTLLIITVFIVVGNLVSDLLYAYVDPRIQ